MFEVGILPSLGSGRNGYMLLAFVNEQELSLPNVPREPEIISY